MAELNNAELDIEYLLGECEKSNIVEPSQNIKEAYAEKVSYFVDGRASKEEEKQVRDFVFSTIYLWGDLGEMPVKKNEV